MDEIICSLCQNIIDEDNPTCEDCTREWGGYPADFEGSMIIDRICVECCTCNQDEELIDRPPHTPETYTKIEFLF